MINLPQPNFRSTSYCVAELRIDCPCCGKSTRIAAVALPPGHEVLEDIEAEEPAPVSDWQPVDANALLFYMTHLPQAAVHHLRAAAPGFERALSTGVQDRCWLNHCEHCNALLDDHELHCEPGDSFVPITLDSGLKIRLTEIPQSFEAAAVGYSLETQFLPFTRRA